MARSDTMMTTALTFGDKASTDMVPLPRPTDALGSTLRDAFAVPPMPEDLADLLRRLDRHAVRH